MTLDKGKHEKARGPEESGMPPTRESWHRGEQSGWGRVETGEATQHVRAEPGLEPKVTWLKAQPFALYPTPLNVGLGGKTPGAGGHMPGLYA